VAVRKRTEIHEIGQPMAELQPMTFRYFVAGVGLKGFWSRIGFGWEIAIIQSRRKLHGGLLWRTLNGFAT
jgi:hypothetical protein